MDRSHVHGRCIFWTVLALFLSLSVGCATNASLRQESDTVSVEQDPCSDPEVSDEESKIHGCGIFNSSVEGLDFGPDDYALNRLARESLDKVIEALNQHPTIVVAIGGHTDNRGTARDNLLLSKKRVMSVVRYLVVNGIEGKRLRPHGYGESRPIYSNATEEGRQRNRRIELMVVKQEVTPE